MGCKGSPAKVNPGADFHGLLPAPRDPGITHGFTSCGGDRGIPAPDHNRNVYRVALLSKLLGDFRPLCRILDFCSC